jgi:hypothetical protein
MRLSKYIENLISEDQRSPIETVIEFVTVYNNWAKECHNVVKNDKTMLDELTKKDSLARKILIEIYNKYCTSKNRQFQRTSKGYFFYGGTYNAGIEIENINEINTLKVEIQTFKIKNITPSKKYTVIKQGQIWKIDTVESLSGTNKWTFDIL